MQEFVRVSELSQHLYFWLLVVLPGLFVLSRMIRRYRARHPSVLSVVQEVAGQGATLVRRQLKALTCVIVDDRPADFPVEFMRGFFGAVVLETQVSLNDAERLSKFNVIFLDVADVVVEDPVRGGAALVECIRRYEQDNLIVSVSSKKYDVEVTNYFELADLRLRKPIRAAQLEEQLIAHMENKVGLEALAREIDAAVRLRFSERKARSLARDLLDASRSQGPYEVPSIAKASGVEGAYKRLVCGLRRIPA